MRNGRREGKGREGCCRSEVWVKGGLRVLEAIPSPYFAPHLSMARRFDGGVKGNFS